MIVPHTRNAREADHVSRCIRLMGHGTARQPPQIRPAAGGAAVVTRPVPAARQFRTFLTAWSIVAVLNAALNGYAGDLPSLPYRGAALGALLLLASGAHGRERVAARLETSLAAGGRIETLVYVALFTAIAVPNVLWRCLAPLDTLGAAGLNHGASIIFVFGVLSLALPRVLDTRAASLGTQPGADG